MTQQQLYRAVARVTGETVDLIHHLGFTELGPLAHDRDQADRWLRGAMRRYWRRRRHASGRAQHCTTAVAV